MWAIIFFLGTFGFLAALPAAALLSAWLTRKQMPDNPTGKSALARDGRGPAPLRPLSVKGLSPAE